MEPNLEQTNTGSVGDIESLKKLIKYVLYRRNYPGKTEIVKICFLIDKAYAELMNSPVGLSTVTYVKYFYGPYADAFQIALESLEKEGEIKNEEESSFLHKYGYVLCKKTENITFEDSRIKELVDKIIREVKGKNLTEIKNIVYSFKEVKQSEFGNVIKFIGDINGNNTAKMEIQGNIK